jgi:transposase
MPLTCTNPPSAPSTRSPALRLAPPRARRPELPDDPLDDPARNPGDNHHPADAAGPREIHLTDLRLRDARLRIAHIASRAAFLPSEQRILIKAIYEEGYTCVEVAALSGQSARTIRREVQRILHRMASTEFVFVAQHLQEWPVTMRRVAQSCILGGEPVRSAASTLHLSLHTVRRNRDMVRLLATGGLSQSAPATRSSVR